MRRFAALFAELDGTRSTERKVQAVEAYLRAAPPTDAAWGLFLLAGRRLQRLVTARALAGWALHVTGAPAWQLEASALATGDLAEAIALLVDAARPAPPPEAEGASLAAWAERLQGLAPLADDARRDAVAGWWRELREDELLVFVKLLTGELRVGVSRGLVERAVARLTGLDQVTVTRRLAGPWEPTPDLLERLAAPADVHDPARPLPFMLACPLEGPADALGPAGDWLVEWKWDGVRAQLVRRAGRAWLWSRGDELLTERFPEVRAAAAALPDGCVLDGELVVVRGDRPLPFALLQRRLGRRRPGGALLAEAPAAFVAFDLLEEGGAPLGDAPLEARRARLEGLLAALPPEARARLWPSPLVVASSWAEAARARDEARARGVEGLVLKRRAGPWQPGRRRGEWWKWKVDPYAFDAVLVAAEPGAGRRASLHSALTFAVWDAAPDDDPPGELVTVARAYSGLADDELRRLDRWVRRHTTEQFGPVRVVAPALVFELRCEGVARSGRHRSGLAVRFPRIARWRDDKRPEDADTLARLEALVPPEPPPPRPEDVVGGQMTLF